MEAMHEAKTYWANIYVGTKEGYDGSVSPISDVIKMVREYTDKVGLGVTITPTYFAYTGGDEPGAIVGLINYPRFPSTNEQIKSHALSLAAILKEQLKQQRVSIVFPDKTIIIGEK